MTMPTRRRLTNGPRIVAPLDSPSTHGEPLAEIVGPLSDHAYVPINPNEISRDGIELAHAA